MEPRSHTVVRSMRIFTKRQLAAVYYFDVLDCETTKPKLAQTFISTWTVLTFPKRQYTTGVTAKRPRLRPTTSCYTANRFILNRLCAPFHIDSKVAI